MEAACSPGLRTHFPARLVHRHRSLDHRNHRAAHAGGHREDGSLHRGDGIAGQNSKAAPALFGGLDDDVAALEVNRLAAPGGGHEQLRSLVDIHHRSVGEPQHRVGSRARADRLVFADGGACFERAARGRRYRPPSAETTVARGPPGAIMPSMASRPRYRTAKSSAAAAARAPHCTQREEDRTWHGDDSASRPSSRRSGCDSRGSG